MRDLPDITTLKVAIDNLQDGVRVAPSGGPVVEGVAS